MNFLAFGGTSGHERGASQSPEVGTPLPPGPLPPVHELVGEFAVTDPSRTAVLSGGRGIGYADLHAWAGRIASDLAALGVGRGDRVAVLAEPSLAMVAAPLGVLRSGAAYVPVDLSHPDQRIADILADAEVGAAIVTTSARQRFADLGLPLITLYPDDDGRPRHTAADNPQHGRASELAEVKVEEVDAAYLIYTSGSTGEPKGVVVEHRNLSASTLARHIVYPSASVFLLLSPLAFDSSVAGLWGTLTAGGCLVVATRDETRDPERLVELIEEHSVTRLLCVPSLYGVLLDATQRLGTDRLRSLDTVTVAGEPLPPELVGRHFTLRAGRTVLVNEYGPTETTVWASYHCLEAPEPVSIGRPVPGTRLYVLDEDRHPVPPGETGELFVGGAGVSRGYHGRPEATARAFLSDPFSGKSGARMYRTGDFVRWTRYGTLEFLGRRDHQVKMRGHRIELGAVETRLCELPGVREAAVVVDEAGTGLVGFVLAPENPTPESMRERLAAQLPPAMVPSLIVVLDSFPRTVNGKTDRAALRTLAHEHDSAEMGPADSGTDARGEATATDSPGEADLTGRVAVAWAEVLKKSHVPTDVNFFDAGGQSLAMFRLQDALERHTGRRPSVVALFRHTTVAAQAAMLRDGFGQADETEHTDAGARRSAARRARLMRARRQDAKWEVPQ